MHIITIISILYSDEHQAKEPQGHGDGEWMARLRAFASSGAWPSGEGNRPAPRQRKWYDLYQKVKLPESHYIICSMQVT